MIPNIKPPKPDLSLEIGGRTSKTIQPGNNIRLVATPRASFLASHPHEARYHIPAVDLLIQNGNGAPWRLTSFNTADQDPVAGITLDTGELLDDFANGIYLYVVPRNVFRVNAQGRRIPLKYVQRDLYLQLRLEKP